MKKIIFLSLAMVLITVATYKIFAETRAFPYKEEYLVKHCPLIFVGRVLEINEHAMPTRVRVLLSIKGNVSLSEREIVPKNPGAFVIFKKEFDKARKGKVGVFFVGQDYNPNLLMKYNEIPGI
jgi:hypothetical protein